MHAVEVRVVRQHGQPCRSFTLRCRCEERLAAQEKAAAAAEAAAAVASAKVEAAADALAMKEQQLVEWRQLAQASKDTASQQLQLSQVRAPVLSNCKCIGA